MRQWIGLFWIGIVYFFTLPIYAQPTDSSFTLTTTSFSTQLGIPKTFTCDDKNISPQLDWKNIPENTKSLVLIVSDPDAAGGVYYHWVLYNIPATVTSLAEGTESVPGTVGRNSLGNMIYFGPCPPKGTTHSYVFTLYALDTLLSLPGGADAPAIIKAAEGHILGQAELVSSFGH